MEDHTPPPAYLAKAFRHGGRDWRALHPGLAAWHTAFAARPALLATAPGA